MSYILTDGKESEMLVLSRKKNEAITISDEIVVKVLQVSRGRVRLGISAPDHIRVHRSEVQDHLREWEVEIPIDEPEPGTACAA